jgi:predicted permease
MASKLEFGLWTFAAKLRGFLSRQRHDVEFDDEIQEHLQLLTEKYVAQGMPSEEAAQAARRQFGNTALLREDRRGLQTLTSLEALWLDLRYSLRALWKSRRFAAVSIVTLALGIGAATAIFSVIDNVLLAPFPYKGASRMVFPRIHGAQQGQDDGRQGYTAAEALELAETSHVFDGTTATQEDLVLYKHGEGTEQLYGAHVTAGTFEFFGMPALYGRVLQPRDYEPGSPPVFVLRYKTWKQQFNGDLAILNKSFVLNGTARTLVGVLPPRFGWYDADLYIPERLTRDAEVGPMGYPNWFFIGRLKPGVTDEQAEADMTMIANRLAKLYPHQYPAQFTVLVKHIGDSVFEHFKDTLYTVLAAVGLLLLIACSNVANLLLARATTREREFALRAALGARRARLIRLLMIESLVLAMAGAALGAAFAWGGLKLLVAAMPQDLIPAEAVIQLNAPVLIFTLCVAVLTALIFGLAPALQSSRHDVNDSLRDSGKGLGSASRGKWLRDAVVVGEVALSLTLLISAGLLMRSFVALRQENLGLSADHVFQTMLVLPADRYKTTEQVVQFIRPLLSRVKALPGVVEAAESSQLPPYGGPPGKIDIAGKAHIEDWQTLLQYINEEYFRALRIELKQGRTFSEVEVNNARKVAVVNETFVRKYLAHENAIGQRVRLANLETDANSPHHAWFEIVGVVGDVTNRIPQRAAEPELWLPYTLATPGSQVLIVRTAQDPATMMDLVRKEVWTVDSGVALAYPNTLENFINRRMYAGPRFGFIMMTIFGCVGLILATVGVYSVLAYSTARKTQEIGIRMALGARPANVLRMVISTGLRLVSFGIAIGVAMSLLLGRFIGSQLIGVTAYDPVTLGATTLLLTLTAVFACWIPARKAARIDPMIALRCE